MLRKNTSNGTVSLAGWIIKGQQTSMQDCLADVMPVVCWVAEAFCAILLHVGCGGLGEAHPSLANAV